MSPVERERFLVTKALAVYHRFTDEKPGSETVFWETIDKAAAANFLDEAIFVHLLDLDLVAAYVTFREHNATRLIEYITTILAPIPPFGGRNA